VAQRKTRIPAAKRKTSTSAATRKRSTSAPRRITSVSAAKAAPAAIREVTISTAGQAFPLSVHVIRRNGDKVKWRAAPGGGPWLITFDKNGSPFRESMFDVPANGAVVTREAHETAEPRPYSYQVRDGVSPFAVRHDPDVDVE
jgi:hypothetical protein